MSTVNTLDDLRREQIRMRCEIAQLYGDLLQEIPPSRKIVNAAHEWTLRHIETLVNDILVNIPNDKAQTNIYSQYFLVQGVNIQHMQSILEALEDALKRHSSLGTRIEHVAKGVA